MKKLVAVAFAAIIAFSAFGVTKAEAAKVQGDPPVGMSIPKKPKLTKVIKLDDPPVGMSTPIVTFGDPPVGM